MDAVMAGFVMELVKTASSARVPEGSSLDDTAAIYAARIREAALKLASLKPSITLQGHQTSAVDQAHTSPGMILNWGLGSGKTIGSIAVAEEKGGNVLVVVPASLRENYRKQLGQVLPPDRRKHYTVISYNAFRADPERWVSETRPTTVVADEFHRLRNPAPREPFERVRHKIPFMLGLTGSLINNRPEEIVPLTNLIAGKQVFKSEEDFDRRFIGQTKVSPGIFARLRGVRPGVREHIQNEEVLGKILRPYIHRFSGDPEYQKHVPQVTEQQIEVEMTSRQEDMLKALQKSNPILDYKIRHNLPPSKSELKNLNAFMTGARQISNNPQAFSNLPTPSPKLERMFNDLREGARKDPNFKAVIYSNFLESGISPLVEGLQHQGVPAESFTGGLNDKQRKTIVDRFNKGHIRVLGLSPAGGEGLDLKGVKQVQLTEEHWNPERTRQAVGRSARFKSHDALPPEERRVQVNRYLAVHPPPGFFARLFGAKRPMSPDQWIDARRREKLELNQAVMGAVPEFQRKAAGVSMMTGFSDELTKLAISGATVWKALKSRILGSTRPIGEKLKKIKSIVGAGISNKELTPARTVQRIPNPHFPGEMMTQVTSHMGEGPRSRGRAMELIKSVQEEYPKLAAAFSDELVKLGVSWERMMEAMTKRKGMVVHGVFGPEDLAFAKNTVIPMTGGLKDIVTRQDTKGLIRATQEIYPKGARFGPAQAAKAQMAEGSHPATLTLMERMFSAPQHTMDNIVGEVEKHTPKDIKDSASQIGDAAARGLHKRMKKMPKPKSSPEPEDPSDWWKNGSAKLAEAFEDEIAKLSSKSDGKADAADVLNYMLGHHLVGAFRQGGMKPHGFLNVAGGLAAMGLGNYAQSKIEKKAEAAFMDELGKLGAEMKSDVKAKFKRPIGKMPGIKPKANPFPKQGDDKTAVSHGKIVRAIFQRAYQGKQVGTTISRMADSFVSETNRMGSPLTRDGLKNWITQVKNTGKV